MWLTFQPLGWLSFASLVTGLFDARIDSRVVGDIRVSVQKGRVLGNDYFKDAIAELTGRRVRERMRGPKAKMV
ncbi:MAG: hypothetical protein COB22_06790 [Cycloclasticus sp.]|nr:MAG: hypothetical protein COB22_06790 [Cycloclasticus sp.]